MVHKIVNSISRWHLWNKKETSTRPAKIDRWEKKWRRQPVDTQVFLNIDGSRQGNIVTFNFIFISRPLLFSTFQSSIFFPSYFPSYFSHSIFARIIFLAVANCKRRKFNFQTASAAELRRVSKSLITFQTF